MRKITTLITLLVALQLMTAKTTLERLEPSFWWTGMENTALQLLVYGEDIASLDVSIDYDGVAIERIIKVENANYLFVDLKLDENVKPGTFDIIFSAKGKEKHRFNYELLARDQDLKVREGFNSTDVMYLITPDRFVNGNAANDNVEGLKEQANRDIPGGRHGGDIQGLINSLDYVSDMGFTAIWVNPVLENDMASYSYHGYSTTDFYKVDPRYGSNEEYRQLAIDAENKDIKLIMDMIVNHIGSEHWWIKDMPTADWINNGGEFVQTSHRRETNVDPHVSEYDLFHNADGWFVETMPDLNQRNPLLATYLIQNTIWWIEYGRLSGIRMDTWPYPDKVFMNEWCEAVLAEYPNFNIVGEEWSGNPAIVSYWQKGQMNHDGYHCALPSLMDFPMQEAIIKTVKNNDRSAYETLAMDFLYPDADNLVVFLDNHDMSRVFTQVDEDYAAYKSAMAYLTIMRGIPQVYYGTEILMKNPGTDDHGVIRTDFPGGWDGDAVDAFTGKGLTEAQKAAQDFTKHLMNWRKNKDVIHHGKSMQFSPLYDEVIYTLARYNADDVVLLLMNNSDEDVEMDMSRYQEVTGEATSMTDVMSGKKVNISTQVTVPAKGFILLEK